MHIVAGHWLQVFTMAGRQANKKLALRITDRCLRLPAVRLPAPARSGQWRRVARLRWTFTASISDTQFFLGLGVDGSCEHFYVSKATFLSVTPKPFSLPVSTSIFYRRVLNFLSFGGWHSISLRYMPCHPPVFILPASLPMLRAGRCLFAHLRSIAFRIRFAHAVPAGDASLTFIFRLVFSFFIPFGISRDGVKVAHSTAFHAQPFARALLISVPFHAPYRPVPSSRPSLHCIPLPVRSVAPAGSSSLTVRFLPFLQ
jgi:hypothetical protein